MKYFNFIDDQLSVEGLKISDIAKEVGTPFYCYSRRNIIENYQVFYNAFKEIDHKICYAIKANPNINIVKIFAAMGAGIDVVSKGEIYRAIKAGIEPKNIVFAGVGKKADEIEYALNEGVEEFSVESEPELYLLNEVARKIDKIAKLDSDTRSSMQRTSWMLKCIPSYFAYRSCICRITTDEMSTFNRLR